MEILGLTKFSCPISSQKNGVKGEIQRNITMQKGETITCAS
jgi:hypothetical protein